MNFVMIMEKNVMFEEAPMPPKMTLLFVLFAERHRNQKQ